MGSAARETRRKRSLSRRASVRSRRFVTSPTVQNINRDLFFNATTSTPPPGRTITGYHWNFGDGTTSSQGPNTSHAYTRAATYVVTLTVTDNVGRTNTTQASITILP